MDKKWIIVLVLLAVAVIVFIGYYVSFYKKPKVFKNKVKVDRVMVSIDHHEKNWILFSNTHLQKKDTSWILFDNMILTDNSLYLVNDLSSVGRLVEPDWTVDEWEYYKDGISKYIKNPIKLYEKQIKYVFEKIRMALDYRILLIVDDEADTKTFETGFAVHLKNIEQLRKKIHEYEAEQKFQEYITLTKKREFGVRIADWAYITNKKNILPDSERKVDYVKMVKEKNKKKRGE